MNKTIPIMISDFSEEFEGVDSEGIVLLTKEQASQVWQKYIDEKATSYFRLPDDNWIIKSEQVIIGEWLSDFNKNRSQETKAKLDSSILWSDNNTVWFCISKALVIETSWYDFKRLWMNFLECEDDGPILLNSKEVNCALLFFSIGNIVKVEAS